MSETRSTIDDKASNSTTHLINYIFAENEVILWVRLVNISHVSDFKKASH